MKTKDIRIDIIRGIGIILMVLGHSHCPGTYYIYLFHMALFFILSGYCYKTSHTDSFKGLLRYGFKKIIRFYVPYVIFNTILVLIDNFVFKRGLDTKSLIHVIISGFFMNHGSTLSGAFWFLRIMLMLLITYGVIDFILKKIPHIKKHTMVYHSVIAVIFLAMGYICSRNKFMFLGIERVMSYYILFHMGRMFKEYATAKLNHPKRIIVIVVSFITLVVCRQFGEIDLDINRYVNPVFLLITSIAGWLLIYEFSYYCTLLKWLYKPLCVIGNNTMAVLIFHFLCFKGITYIQILIYDLPKSYINAFPVLYNMPLWWLAYTIVGLGIPVGISLLYKKLIPHQK